MLPGPGAALALTPDNDVDNGTTSNTRLLTPDNDVDNGTTSNTRLLFCGHYGGYYQDVVYYSDDAGQTFQVSASTPWNRSVLQKMDECSFTRFANGTALMIMRNNGGYGGHDPRGAHNPRCADGGMCKAFSLSHDRGETWSPPAYLSGARTGSCESAVLAVAADDPDSASSTLLFSGGDTDTPPRTGRRRMTLRKSTDGGATWPTQWLLDAGLVAYSQLVVLPSRRRQVGVLWEAQSPDGWFIGEMRLAWVQVVDDPDDDHDDDDDDDHDHTNDHTNDDRDHDHDHGKEPTVAAVRAASCRPELITDTYDAGCGRWFPRFHPKNALPLAHNNDANAPFRYRGMYHLFMQADFPGTPGWNGAIGVGHLASRDLARWRVLPPALLPGRWPGRTIGGVGLPSGNATGGYYSGSATIVGGVPRIMVPSVWGTDHPDGPGTGPHGAGNCDWTKMGGGSNCRMVYSVSRPTNLSDPFLVDWSEPHTVVDGRVDGVQPHGPGFDDVTHAWQDDDDEKK
eukprot:g5955.t1